MTKRKILIKVNMPNAKSRSQAMVLAAKANGVSSIGIAGEDQLEVVGDGVDIACLVKCLKKKLCSAEILKVEEVKDKKPEEKKPEEKKPEPKKEEPTKPCTCPAAAPCACASYYHTPLHTVFCDDEPPAALCHIL
ncbi:unnamed protein product [Urochloa humidicola]